MHHFIRDEGGYLRWLDAHPDGYVINLPQAPGGPVVLHHARCAFIRGQGRTNFTGGQYTKVCDMQADALKTWVAERDRTLGACGTCRPGGRGAPAHRPVQTTSATARPAQVPPAVRPSQPWSLWGRGAELTRIEDIEPHLDSWDKHTHPSQRSLKVYLDRVVERLGPLPDGDTPLYLHLDVDRQSRAALVRQPDIENYLTPVARRLGPRRLRLVSGTKVAGGGSRIVVGVAERCPVQDLAEWGHFVHAAQNGVGSTEWKVALRQALAATGPQPLPAGPVTVQLAWRCSPTRPWLDFWKPSGDAMGPVLGEPDGMRPFNPADDRIISLQLHRISDAQMGFAVETAMWWRMDPTQPSSPHLR